MWRRCLVFACLISAIACCLGCQGISEKQPSPASSSRSGQILYVINNLDVTTYAVDPDTLESAVIGASVTLAPPSSSLIQILSSPNDHFLYALWLDDQHQEHLSTYTTHASGVPQLPPLQALQVNSLSQFNIHPSGNFAYALQVDASNNTYTSTLFLFEIQASGILRQPQTQGIYGPSLMPTLLQGLDPEGRELYLVSDDLNGPVYWQRSVNAQNGALGPDILLFRPPAKDSVVFGATLIVDYENAMDCSRPRYVNIMRNTPNPPQPLIQCGSAMLDACGSASDIQLDPSGVYLFLTDTGAQQVRVGRVDVPAAAVRDTGKFLAAPAQVPGFAFSPDGTLVYVLLANDSRLHIYGFDPTSGNLTLGSTSISVPAGSGFLPALRR